MPFEQITPRTFTIRGVQIYAPPAAGVYGISNSREWLYIGETENIQSALLTHLKDVETPLMKREPKGFVFEVCAGASRTTRADRLVLEYAPACNRVSPEHS
jgi:hypothetical protein